MASALMAAYLRVVVFTLYDIEIYLRMVNKFLFFFQLDLQNSVVCPTTVKFRIYTYVVKLKT
jgi:hypothetical protein